MSLLNIGLTGLNVAQSALATTGHNISSANVEGYSRQRVVLTTNDPQYTGSGYLGKGSKVESIERVYSQFLENQVLSADTRRAELDTYSSAITQLDNMLADTNAGLSPALQDFFKGVQDLAANPSSIPARQAMLSNAQALTSRFQTMYERMDEIRDATNGQIADAVTTINSLTNSLADMNKQIAAASNNGNGVPPNDLLDQRNILLEKLNQQVRVTTSTASDGSINVFMGSGQPLVVNSDHYELAVAASPDDPTQMGVKIKITPTTSVNLPDDYINGGSLGGLLSFRNVTLDNAQNALGRVAQGLIETFNAQHNLGQDLNGNMGLDFFTGLSPHVQNLVNSTTGVATAATLSASFGTVSNLTDADYILSYDGTNYKLTNQADNTVAYSGATLPSNVDGITLSVASGTVVAGDRFLIQPTRYAARDISVAINDTRLLAAAAPITTSAAKANSGDGAISAGSVVSLTGISSSSPHISAVTLTYDSTIPGFTMTGGASGTLAYNPVTDASGKSFTIASPNVSITMSGTPANGDVFTIGNNTNGNSDSRNAVLLGALQSAKTLIGGTASYQSAYSQLVSSVGSKASQVEVGLKAQEGLVTQAKSAQQALSGVNLDEEAANLILFQQAYQASARVMQVSDTLFNEILNLGR